MESTKTSKQAITNGKSKTPHYGLTNGHSNHGPPPTKRRFTNSRLPIYQRRDQFNALFKDNNILLVVGETGSGKTTQIPQWCMDFCKINGNKQLCVACTQPRRIAAMSVANRVAQEMHVTLGHDVGYSVRFEQLLSPQTVLKYLTDGMLLREAMIDSLLSAYGVVIIDEAHERTLQTEILFGVVMRAMKTRNDKSKDLPPLKVIIMSATLDTKLYSKPMKPAVLMIEGRQHSVQDMSAKVPQSDLLTSTLVAVFQIHRNEGSGDILVFCSGQDEIHSLIMLCKKVLKQAPESLQNLTPLPLYASLPATHQMKVFDVHNHSDNMSLQNGNSFVNGNNSVNGNSSINGNGVTNGSGANIARRVIFATNVAETSVTIPNIKFVIDTGKVKCRTYCPKTGLESLKITTISKSQAKQRSGRAGRTSPGICYRLYTDDDYDNMAEYPIPEIKRCNLDSVLLQMISIGIQDIKSFEFLEAPENARLKAAISNLLNLKAIKSSQKKEGHVLNDDQLLDFSYELTSVGERLSSFPLNPSMSRVLLAANELGCLDEALTIVSLLYVENLFHIPPHKQAQADTMLEKFKSNEGDTIMLLKVYKAFMRTASLNRAGLKQWCVEHFIHGKNLKLARLVRKQLADLCKSLDMGTSSCGQDTTLVRKALTYGLFNNVATMWNGKYRNKSVSDIHIHPNSCLFKLKPECVLYVELVETNKCYMKNCTLIDMNWVREISSAHIQQRQASRT